MTAVLDGLSAPAVGAGESQAAGLGALSLAMLAVSVDGTCSAWRCPLWPECCTRRSRTAMVLAGKYRSGCVNAKWRRPWLQCTAFAARPREEDEGYG